jgi:hypothetical protein
MIAEQTTCEHPASEFELPSGIDSATADAILTQYLSDPGASIPALARRFQRPVISVGLLLNSDFGRSVIQMIESLAEQRAGIFAAEARVQAIVDTARIARTSKSDETARRAAASILNFKTYIPPSRKSNQARANRPALAPDASSRVARAACPPVTTPSDAHGLASLREPTVPISNPADPSPPAPKPTSTPAPLSQPAPDSNRRAATHARSPRDLFATAGTLRLSDLTSPLADLLAPPSLAGHITPPARAAPAA